MSKETEDYGCDYCDKSFDTPLKAVDHEEQAHGESVA